MTFTALVGQRAVGFNVTRGLEEVMHSPPLSVDRQLEIADCVMNVDQAVFYLMSAGLFIDAAVSGCPSTPDSFARANCAASITGVLSTLGWASTYIAAASTECAHTVNPKAVCAADVAWVVASLSEISFAGSSIARDCPPLDAYDETKDIWYPWAHAQTTVTTTKALSKKEKVLEVRAQVALENKNKAIKGTFCYIDVGMAATYLIRAAKQLHDGIRDCPDPANGEVCAIDIFNVISSLAWVAEFIAFLVSDCPIPSNREAYCAGDISDVVAGVASLGASMLAITNDCTKDALSVTPV